MIPQNIERQCIKWVHRLQGLVSINIPNCYKPLKLEDIKDCSMHCFSDASVACRHKWEHPLYLNNW